MSHLMRVWLIWLLVLALPAQAAASAAMVGCGPGHLAAAGADDHAGHHAMAGQASDPAAHAHAHGPAPADLAGAVSQALSGSSPAAEAGAALAADGHTCSACAACCLASAIPAALPAVPMPEFVTTVFADWAAGVGTFAVDGPERPPRSALA